MNTITDPKPVTTPIASVDTPLFRLELKRVGCGLSPEEQAALDEIYAQEDRSIPTEADIDRLAALLEDARTEARTFPQRHVNFHE